MGVRPKSGELPPSSKLRKLLAISLYSLEKTPGLSADDIGWLRSYALRLLIVPKTVPEVPAKR